MLYEKENCPVCGKTFVPGDDIVVCPECGTPHHRECWTENGACANSGLHSEGFVWKNSENAVESGDSKNNIRPGEPAKVCPLCGYEDADGNEDCPLCKNTGDENKNAENGEGTLSQLSSYFGTFPFIGIDPSEELDGIKALDIALYVRFSAHRYLDKFRKALSNPKKPSWNWAAFFFSPYWFFFRKLYWLGGIFLGLHFALSVAFAGPMGKLQTLLLEINRQTYVTPEMDTFIVRLAEFFPMMLINLVLNLVLRCSAAAVAVPAYRNKVFKDLRSIRRFAADENVFRALTLRRGGTSGFALMGSVLLFDLLWITLNYIVSQL